MSAELPQHLAYQASKGETPTPVQTAKVGLNEFPFTPPDILGPYFLPDSPATADLALPYTNPVLTLSGVVTDKTGMPLPNCKLDFWMARPDGVYSGFADQGTDGQTFCRGHVFTDEDGNYRVTFNRPGHYGIGGGEERTSHVHLRAKPTNGPELTTQLYFEDDPYNAKDGWQPKNDPMLNLRNIERATEFLFDVVLKTFH